MSRPSWPRWFWNQILHFGYAFMIRWHQNQVIKCFRRKNPEKGREHMRRAFHWNRKQDAIEYIREAE